MTKSSIAILLVGAICFQGCKEYKPETWQFVNPVLGDISYFQKFGGRPGATTDENLRITTHLEYVENLLRKKDVPSISTGLLQRRFHMLNLLREYIAQGVYPRNFKYSNKRVPCFIDDEGRICAVGYLIEKTAGREVAEYINSKYQYEELLAMEGPIIEQWIANSGLTKEECAMIQPTYRPADNSSYIHAPEAFLTGGLTGLNMGFTTMNIMNISKGKSRYAIPVVSMATGLGQAAFGTFELVKYQREGNQWFMGDDYTTMKTIGMANIAIGTVTTMMGIYTLSANRDLKQPFTSWNIFSFPATEEQVGLGMSFSKRF